jgi:hypothetical protein
MTDSCGFDFGRPLVLRLTRSDVQDLRFNCRFADVMKSTKDGIRVADFRHFNQVIQNTVMPVSYGLTLEETHSINGPDVLHRPPNRRPPSSSGFHGPPTSPTMTSLTPSLSGWKRWDDTGGLGDTRPLQGVDRNADGSDDRDTGAYGAWCGYASQRTGFIPHGFQGMLLGLEVKKGILSCRVPRNFDRVHCSKSASSLGSNTNNVRCFNFFRSP